MEHDPGNSKQRSDYYDVEVGNAPTYYGAPYMLAMELEKERISNIIEAIGMEGTEACR